MWLHIDSYTSSRFTLCSPSTVGMLEADGTMHVTLCGLFEPWDNLTATQKMGLTERYQMGCECRVWKIYD